MNKCIIDTDILSMFLRNHVKVRVNFANYLIHFEKPSISVFYIL